MQFIESIKVVSIDIIMTYLSHIEHNHKVARVKTINGTNYGRQHTATVLQLGVDYSETLLYMIIITAGNVLKDLQYNNTQYGYVYCHIDL